MELKTSKRLASRANGQNFGVSRWIVGLGDRIDAGSDNTAVLYKQGAERTAAAALNVLNSQLDGGLYPLFMTRLHT